MSRADYAPPGYFAAHPWVEGFQFRDRFIGLRMDLMVDVLMHAYQYESDTHGQVVKDGLNIHIQVSKESMAAPLYCTRQTAGMPAYAYNSYLKPFWLNNYHY